jgi:anti-sigma28 factor (negative regulator of flagellin synthesis)
MAKTPKSSADPRLAHNEEQLAELRTGDQLRADKLKKIKEQIAANLFQVDSKEVAKSIARRWRNTSPPTWQNDLLL